MNKQKFLGKRRVRRKQHVRNSVRGTADRPRLCVVRSHKHIGCQLVDDSTGKTLVSASTRDKGFSVGYGGNKDAATAVGKALAEKAISAGIQAVRFDRGSCKYHGRVAALADAAREAGLTL